ncbi:hypothetical protein ACHAW5_000619 [Stephanodiscus triporus]|uniref:HECT-type E3 ubiquitin transferase n=1 Tax=Stephanodiscus triporus TaxID=2934178 RepID=A0ABD3NWQ8_9STRA
MPNQERQAAKKGDATHSSLLEEDVQLDNLQMQVPGAIFLLGSELALQDMQDDLSYLTLDTFTTMGSIRNIDGQRRLGAIDESSSSSSSSDNLAKIKLGRAENGWTRTIRATDMMFQWTRFDERENVDERTRFDADQSAYVLKLDYLDDNDKLRRGRCSLVAADEGAVDSKIKSTTGSDLVSYSDIVNAQMKTFDDKAQWFQDTCAKLCEDWNRVYMKINVRRDYLLEDSMEAVMSLSRKDLRKVWRFEFIDEAGIDDGALTREWFELVTGEMFDPAVGLWQMSESDPTRMQISNASEIACPYECGHLTCFRFLGRVMGKAMFDQQLVKGRMVKHFYKHILGWPVTFKDLKDIDYVYYKSLKSLQEMGADIEYVGLDFTMTEERLGMKEVVELRPDGANVDVTVDNLPEYIEACLKYHLLGRYEAQLNELLLGFFDVIPEPLLTIFDCQELELLMTMSSV